MFQNLCTPEHLYFAWTYKECVLGFVWFKNVLKFNQLSLGLGGVGWKWVVGKSDFKETPRGTWTQT